MQPDSEQPQAEILNYSDARTEGPLKLIILCRMPSMEAELARAKLESEGVECIVRDSNMAIAHPLLVSEVPLLVKAEDIARAREILARPAEDGEEGDYADEAWRCPKCHRRSIDLLPLKGIWRFAKNACLMLVAIPITLLLLDLFLPPATNPEYRKLADYTVLPWVAFTLTSSITWFLAPRTKRCRDCGHKWRQSDA